jgi:hypothetical protein
MTHELLKVALGRLQRLGLDIAVLDRGRHFMQCDSDVGALEPENGLEAQSPHAAD